MLSVALCRLRQDHDVHPGIVRQPGNRLNIDTLPCGVEVQDADGTGVISRDRALPHASGQQNTAVGSGHQEKDHADHPGAQARPAYSLPRLHSPPARSPPQPTGDRKEHDTRKHRPQCQQRAHRDELDEDEGRRRWEQARQSQGDENTGGNPPQDLSRTAHGPTQPETTLAHQFPGAPGAGQEPTGNQGRAHPQPPGRAEGRI